MALLQTPTAEKFGDDRIRVIMTLKFSSDDAYHYFCINVVKTISPMEGLESFRTPNQHRSTALELFSSVIIKFLFALNLFVQYPF